MTAPWSRAAHRAHLIAATREACEAVGDLGSGLFWMEILHDDDCPLLAGHGPCRCTPDIVVREIGKDAPGKHGTED